MLPLIIIAGPTTSKKSDTAIELAEKLNTEIISADSMQVYKYFDIGTAKVSPEGRARVPHHLIDILEPTENFTAFDFKTLALALIRDLVGRNKIPIITGGTGLYLKVLCEDYNCAVQINPEIKKQVQSETLSKGLLVLYKELQGVDPTSAKQILPTDKQRIERAVSVYRQTGIGLSAFNDTYSKSNYEFPIYTFLIKRDRESLYTDINQRVDNMIKNGWIEEVKGIIDGGFSKNLKPFQSIGYSQIVDFLDKKKSLEQTIDLIKRDTRHYAKRQITWFKKLYDSKTIDADSRDSPITLRNKILSLIPKTVISVLLLFLFAFEFAPTAAAKTNTYSSALSQFQKENYIQAAILFQKIHSSNPNSKDGKRALYLLGHSLTKVKKSSEAIDVFLSSLISYPEIEDYIRFHLAKVLMDSNKNTEALEQINILHKNFPETLLFTQSKILLAKVLEQSDKIEDALSVLAETEKRISSFPKSFNLRSYLPEIIYLQGQLYQKIRKINEAYNRYRLLHIDFPSSPLTRQAKEHMNELSKVEGIIIIPLTIDEHTRRIRKLLSDVKYQQTVTEVTDLLAIESPLPGKFYFYLAQAQKGLRKRNLANSALRKFINHFPDHSRVQEALFNIGRNFWNTGYYRDGLKYFETSIEENPNSNLANQARFFIGKMHEEKKRYSQATSYYEALIHNFRSSEYAERAAWQLGWLNYTKGDFQKSFDYFGKSSQEYPSGLFIESSMFWAAKSLEKLNRKELATQLFNDLNFKFPYTYYGIRSGEKGNKKIVSKLNNNQEISINNPTLSSIAKFHYSRSVELTATGFHEDARNEISNLEKSVRKNFSGVIWLTSLYNNAHAYSDTVRILQLYKNFKTKIGEKELSYNFWKNFYPPAYDKTIRNISKNLGVNPYFVQGLIRQESLFNAKVQSRAGAIGLMQIMPKTGRSLHTNSNMTRPFKTDILFDPETNIQLGIQYIHQLKNRFKKNKTHVLISYNAGPHNLKKWLTRFKHIDDPDVFIESIPYPETRKYVKKVLRNHGIYKTLYTDIQP